MPAYFDTGYCVRDRSWHGLENLLEFPPDSIEAAREAAGILWEPEYVPVYNGQGEKIEGFKGIQRNDNGYMLNIARDTYEVISNQETFEIVWAVMKHGAYLDTAGSVRDGRQVWALAHLDEPIVIPGDKSLSYPYLVMLTSHDGTAACKILPTTVRVVCWNTFQMALSEGDRTGIQLSFRHTKRVKDRIAEAKRAIEGTRNFAEKWQKDAEQLVSLKVTPPQAQQFVLQFFPTPPADQVVTDRQVDNLIMNRATLQYLIDNSPTLDGIRDTAYGLVQAAGEYLDHLRGGRGGQDAYISRTLLRPEPEKSRAVKLAIACAKS